MGSLYDAVCARSYEFLSRTILPDLRNSQYAYGDALRSLLASGSGTWMDLGCGHDFLPPWFRADDRKLDLRGWRVIGLDADLDALQRHGNLRHKIFGTAERIPVVDGSLSLISANMMVEHVEHPESLFAEIGRVLAPGGRALIHTPNLEGYTTRLTRAIPDSLLKPLAKALLNRASEDVYPTYYRANTEAAMRAAADRAGLRLVRCEHVDSSPQFYRVPPVMAMEVALMRLARRPRLASLRPCLIAVFEKPRHAG
jgi:SAM-dependent methyltransferase